MIKRLTRNALFLALMCIFGMISIPINATNKVTLQLIILLIAFTVQKELIDKLIVPACYCVLGLFLPIFAGFSNGFTTTFGFIIGFIFAAIPFHFALKIKNLKFIYKYLIASFLSLLTIYLFGSIFMSLYLQINFIQTVIVGVLPYIVIDIAKIIFVFIVVQKLRIDQLQ
jgi:biotin transport system substrate-specific component